MQDHIKSLFQHSLLQYHVTNGYTYTPLLRFRRRLRVLWMFLVVLLLITFGIGWWPIPTHRITNGSVVTTTAEDIVVLAAVPSTDVDAIQQKQFLSVQGPERNMFVVHRVVSVKPQPDHDLSTTPKLMSMIEEERISTSTFVRVVLEPRSGKRLTVTAGSIVNLRRNVGTQPLVTVLIPTIIEGA